MKPPWKSNIDTWKENVCTDELMINFPHWLPYSVHAVSMRTHLRLPLPKRQHRLSASWSALRNSTQRSKPSHPHSLSSPCQIPFLHTRSPHYHCKVSVEWLNSLLPWFPVDAFVFLHMFVATFIAKRTSCCPPEMAFISIHWTCELRLIHTATREQRMKTAC